MSESDDKRELLRLKQGLISESETIKEEKPVFAELHGKKKVENFFYHNKVNILLIAFVVSMAVFFTIDFLSREKMDLKVIVCTNTIDSNYAVFLNSEDIKTAFDELCEDYDGNGNAHADVDVINLVQTENTDPNTFAANSTRLFGEMQSGTGQLLVANLDVYYNVLGQGEEIDFLTDLSEIYPDDPNVHERYFYKVKGSLLDETVDWEECPDDLYFAVRIAGTEAKYIEYHARALSLLDKMVK